MSDCSAWTLCGTPCVSWGPTTPRARRYGRARYAYAFPAWSAHWTYAFPAWAAHWTHACPVRAQHGALAVANLAVSHPAHGALMATSECAAALGRAAGSPDADVRRCIGVCARPRARGVGQRAAACVHDASGYAAFGISNFASNEAIHEDMLRWSLVRVVVLLLSASVAAGDDYATLQARAHGDMQSR